MNAMLCPAEDWLIKWPFQWLILVLLLYNWREADCQPNMVGTISALMELSEMFFFNILFSNGKENRAALVMLYYFRKGFFTQKEEKNAICNCIQVDVYLSKLSSSPYCLKHVSGIHTKNQQSL